MKRLSNFTDRTVYVLRERDITKNKTFLYFIAYKKGHKQQRAMMWYKFKHDTGFIINFLGLVIEKTYVAYVFGTNNYYFFKERK